MTKQPLTLREGGLQTNEERPRGSWWKGGFWLDLSPLYGWPNQVQHGFEDQSLFDFSGLQDFSGANNFNSDTYSNNLNDLNSNTPTNVNKLSYVPVAPVANIDTPTDANTLSNVPAVDISNTASPTANKSRKHKSDETDLVLLEGSHRNHKKKSHADENIPVSKKRAQSSRK